MGSCGRGGTRRDVLGPAFERSPATDAVAMMEPEEVGFDFEVCSMAFAAYLIARKTLVVLMTWSAMIGLEPTVLSKGFHLRTFVLIVFMNSSPSISWKVLFNPIIPAFANMMSNLPYFSRASSTVSLTAASSAPSYRRQ